MLHWVYKHTTIEGVYTTSDSVSSCLTVTAPPVLARNSSCDSRQSRGGREEHERKKEWEKEDEGRWETGTPVGTRERPATRVHSRLAREERQEQRGYDQKWDFVEEGWDDQKKRAGDVRVVPGNQDELRRNPRVGQQSGTLHQWRNETHRHDQQHWSNNTTNYWSNGGVARRGSHPFRRMEETTRQECDDRLDETPHIRVVMVKEWPDDAPSLRKPSTDSARRRARVDAHHAGFVPPPDDSVEPPLHRWMLALSTALSHSKGVGRWEDIVPALPSIDQLTADWEQMMLQYIHHITDTPLSGTDTQGPMSSVEPATESLPEVLVQQSPEAPAALSVTNLVIDLTVDDDELYEPEE
ncbi:hypothetical protein GG344DRAFT_71516, partial [Lentinula edodes]